MSIVDEVRRVLICEGQAIQDCAERLDNAAFSGAVKKAVDILQESLTGGGKIIVTGVGKSGKIAQKIAATFCSTGSLAVFLHPTEGLHGDIGVVRPGDAVLALSYTGNTEELIRILPSFRTLKVKVIGLGGNSQSKLAEKCDVWLDASVGQEACPHNLAPTSSTTLALALGDALAMALMKLRGFDVQAFAQSHPGGALGNRLNLRVSDVMHHGDEVAVLAPSASVDEVIVQATAKKLGGVLIVENQKLVGLVVDGDIRRALQNRREDFFQLKAGDIMTRSPSTVEVDAMAATALELMENRPFQITVLPVVDAKGNWKGLVRLHDLVRLL
jgi:arabinose-5-phosphate isomerase